MGSTTIKIVKGREYLYYVYYDNGQKKNIYCGLASKPESQKKALELELEYMKNQSKNLSQKMIETERKIKKITN